MNEFKFEFGTGYLQFEVDSNGWSKVYGLFGNERIKLGAENFDVIVNKLSSNISRYMESREPKHILSLSESHCSLYKLNANGKTEYIWQNSKAEEIFHTTIDEPLFLKKLNDYAKPKNV